MASKHSKLTGAICEILAEVPKSSKWTARCLRICPTHDIHSQIGQAVFAYA